MDANPTRKPLGNIVVGTDFTRHAHDAAARAAWLPVGRGASITILHVIPTGLPPEVEARLRATSEAMQRGAIATFGAESERAGRAADLISAVAVGRAADCIAERAHDLRAELIVVGRGERHGLSDRLLGSTAERIVRSAECSVLLVATPPQRPYARPFAGTDLSELSLRSVELAARLAGPSGAVEAVHAFDVPYVSMLREGGMKEPELADYLAEIERSARNGLEAWIARAAKLGVSVKGFIQRGDPRRVVLEEASAGKADLIVVGHRGHSVLGRLLLGSVAEGVMRRAPCDVLVVH
jgi:nucleotide-binding universal stress UspA family protein